MRLCITGCAGFVGYSVATLCLDTGIEVHGVDHLGPGDDLPLKEWRLQQLSGSAGFRFHHLDVLDHQGLERLVADVASKVHVGATRPFDGIIHLAAVSNVRRSIEDPDSTYRTNVLGTLSMLEACAHWRIKRFVLASSASVYGGLLPGEPPSEGVSAKPRPSRECDPSDNMLSPYAASKKAAEDLCRLYHRMHEINAVVLRYFAPYGPAGRQDMSVFRFVRLMTEGQPVFVYGKGTQLRDFTYISDIARGTLAALGIEGFEVINLGGGAPVSINHVLDRLEACLGMPSRRIEIPPPPADVLASWADISKAKALLSWAPSTSLDEGLRQTVDWHQSHRDWLRELPLDCPPRSGA